LEIEKIFKKIIFPSSAKSTNSKYFYIPQKTSKPILVRVSDHQTITWETNLNDYSKYINIKYNSITLKKFGSVSTSINKMASAKVAYGSSKEDLGQSKLQGLSDGIIFFLRDNLELERTVRSFAAASLREWSTVSRNNLAVGTLEKSGKNEVAITKFNRKGVPQWTKRITGRSSPVVDGVRVGFITKSKISSIPGFAPKRSTAVFLTFNKKGVIRAISSAPALALYDLNDG
jgi:hypothetical protein